MWRLDGDRRDYGKEIEIAQAHMLRFVEWHERRRVCLWSMGVIGRMGW